MDPYIESSRMWGDFHGSLLGAIRGELNARLPSGYVASIELYVWTEESRPRRHRRPLEPDVYVREQREPAEIGAVATATTAPVTILLPTLEPRKHRYIKVSDVRTKRVVTVLEVLSPANKKAGPDRELYLTKRSDYLANRINLVEIDLLRGGRRLPLGNAPEVADYYVMVSRNWEYPAAGIWAFTVRDPLPDIPIPLTPELPDTLLLLRPCVDRVYDEGRYAESVPYDEPVKPRLSKSNSSWVREVLAGGKRVPD
jgi:hypothetical protein